MILSHALFLAGIEAEVLVVESFDELKSRASEAKGKIVVYNQPFVSYGETVAYRASGASEAAKVGAVASLIRSITPFSINRSVPFRYHKCLSMNNNHFISNRLTKNNIKLIVCTCYSPHTGWQWYQSGVPQIPTACITVEDAQMMARMARQGTKIVVHLTLGAQTLEDVDSFNTVAEITGSEHPEQVSS